MSVRLLELRTVHAPRGAVLQLDLCVDARRISSVARNGGGLTGSLMHPVHGCADGEALTSHDGTGAGIGEVGVSGALAETDVLLGDLVALRGFATFRQLPSQIIGLHSMSCHLLMIRHGSPRMHFGIL